MNFLYDQKHVQLELSSIVVANLNGQQETAQFLSLKIGWSKLKVFYQFALFNDEEDQGYSGCYLPYDVVHHINVTIYQLLLETRTIEEDDKWLTEESEWEAI